MWSHVLSEGVLLECWSAEVPECRSPRIAELAGQQIMISKVRSLLMLLGRYTLYRVPWPRGCIACILGDEDTVTTVHYSLNRY